MQTTIPLKDYIRLAYWPARDMPYQSAEDQK